MNYGRAHLCASLGELSSEYVVFNIYKNLNLFSSFQTTVKIDISSYY